VVRSYYTRIGKNKKQQNLSGQSPHNFVIIMKACTSSILLIASSELFPDHAYNTSYYNIDTSPMLEYLLICYGSCKQKENEALLQNMLNLLPL